MELTIYPHISAARRDGYISASEAARVLGVSRQYAHRLKTRDDWPPVAAMHMYRAFAHPLYRLTDVLVWRDQRDAKRELTSFLS